MTRTLTLRNRFQGNSTIVENDFIDNHMAKANGEYVKVYLLLLRHLNANNSALSIAGLADCLECTEKDILRAFKHWSKEGLLKIDYDEAGNICGLAIGKAAVKPEINTEVKVEVRPEVKPETKATSTAVKQVLAKQKTANPEELRQLYFIAEQYMGKPLSANDIKKINYFFDSLDFSIDLIEYLIEYCVENGHRNFRYIETVALAWSDSGIKSVEEAKMNTSTYTKNCFSVLNAFGIKGRNPAPAETEFIKKWTEQYGFTLDIILEACNRTINNTHKPDFKYTDSILSSWVAKEVHHLTDISRLDMAYQKEKESKKRNAPKATAINNQFNNFEGRSYDMNSLEQQLLKTN